MSSDNRPFTHARLSSCPARRAVRWTCVLPWVASALLMGCASSSPHRAPRGDLRYLDTETAGRLRHGAATGHGASALAPAAARTVVASILAESVPVLLVLLESDNAVGELEEQLEECARLAEREVNSEFFGGRAPTRAECGEEVDVDGCGEPITRAMLLGQRKHELALQCASEVLEKLWPKPYSIEQRYRYYPNARVLETVSRQEEARLIKEGCTKELWRTFKPDIVLHADGNLLRSAVTLDYKFPCPDTNDPRWKEYGENSAYYGFTQGGIYTRALGGKSFLISPRLGVTQ